MALLAVLAGGTAVALGATGRSHSRSHSRHLHAAGRRHGVLGAASGYLGVPVSQLRSELASGRTLGQIVAATPGRTEAGLVAALVVAARQRLHNAEAQVPARIQSLVRGLGGPALSRHRHGAVRQVVLAYLGVDRKTLASELHSGKTLAQVADATPAKSAAGLREAIISALKKRLDTKLASGEPVAKGDEASRLAQLETRVSTLLNRSHKSIALHGHRPAA